MYVYTYVCVELHKLHIYFIYNCREREGARERERDRYRPLNCSKLRIDPPTLQGHGPAPTASRVLSAGAMRWSGSSNVTSSWPPQTESGTSVIAEMDRI